MKIKTSELTGAALDWAVAKAEGINDVIVYHGFVRVPIPLISGRYPERGIGYKQYRPSASWRIAGPIIEREGIDLWCNVPSSVAEKNTDWKSSWRAAYHRCGVGSEPIHGLTPLIAAMRCFVHSKLGPEVEIPEELIK